MVEIVRNIYIKVRCTAAEREAWKLKARGYNKSLSELMRESMDRVLPFTPDNKKLLGDRTRELAKIGNNINQLARWANSYKSSTDAVEVIEALMLLKSHIEHSFPATPRLVNHDAR